MIESNQKEKVILEIKPDQKTAVKISKNLLNELVEFAKTKNDLSDLYIIQLVRRAVLFFMAAYHDGNILKALTDFANAQEDLVDRENLQSIKSIIAFFVDSLPAKEGEE